MGALRIRTPAQEVRRPGPSPTASRRLPCSMLTVCGAIPFALLLLAIAVLPLLVPRWWHRHYPLVVALLGLPVLFGYLFFARDIHRIGEVLVESLGFIAGIGSLYVIAGGIYLRIVRPPTPFFNTFVLLTGGLIANVIGTTGASHAAHPFLPQQQPAPVSAYLVVFFIFVVANIGGGLGPIGDPPLLDGYPSEGSLFLGSPGRPGISGSRRRRWSSALSTGFDRRNTTGRYAPRPLRLDVQGYWNLLFLAIVLIAVFAPCGTRTPHDLRHGSVLHLHTQVIYRQNRFSFRPIIEVAVLFAGIFVTMAPVLDLIDAHAHSLGLGSASGFYWVTGMLSGILDLAGLPDFL